MDKILPPLPYQFNSNLSSPEIESNLFENYPTITESSDSTISDFIQSISHNIDNLSHDDITMSSTAPDNTLELKKSNNIEDIYVSTRIESKKISEKTNYNWIWWIIFGFVMLTLIILFILWILGYLTQSTPAPSPTPSTEIYVPFGFTDANNLKYSTELANNKEIFLNKEQVLTILSNISENSINSDINDLNLLMSQCNSNINCKGIIYNPTSPSLNSLIISDIEILPNSDVINLPPDKSLLLPQIYVNTSRGIPIVDDKVFVYIENPKQFWINQPDITPTPNNPNSGFSTFLKGLVYTINWIPNFEINSSKLTGIWSVNPFKSTDFNSLLTSNDINIYKDDVENRSNINENIYSLGGLNPVIFKYGNPIFVMYDYKPPGLKITNVPIYISASTN